MRYRICRTALKHFFAQRPDGRGGWLNGLGDERLILYHLNELVGHTQVVLVEGEKDADRLWSLDILHHDEPVRCESGRGQTEVARLLRTTAFRDRRGT